MNWKPEHRELLKRFAARIPLPQRREGEDFEAFWDRCRAWMKLLGEQFAFSFGPGWGRKRADPNRPWSKDNLPYKDASAFVGFDTMLGAGTGRPSLAADNPLRDDLTGQYFEALPPVDHLAEPQPEPQPQPEPEPQPELSALEQRVLALEAMAAAFGARLAQYDAVVRALRGL